MHYSLVADSQQVEMLVFTREQFTRMEREQPAIAEKIMTHVMEKVRLRFVVVPGSILNSLCAVAHCLSLTPAIAVDV